MAGSATTRWANAASSTPAPMQAPCTCTTVRPAHRSIQIAAPRLTRTAWAVAGSAAVPNSDRSPPLQNDGTRPRLMRTSATVGVEVGDLERGDEPVTHGRVVGVVDTGRCQPDRQDVAVAGDRHRVGSRPRTGRPGRRHRPVVLRTRPGVPVPTAASSRRTTRPPGRPARRGRGRTAAAGPGRWRPGARPGRRTEGVEPPTEVVAGDPRRGAVGSSVNRMSTPEGRLPRDPPAGHPDHDTGEEAGQRPDVVAVVHLDDAQRPVGEEAERVRSGRRRHQGGEDVRTHGRHGRSPGPVRMHPLAPRGERSAGPSGLAGRWSRRRPTVRVHLFTVWKARASMRSRGPDDRPATGGKP